MENETKVAVVILNYNTYQLTIKEIENIEDVIEGDQLNIFIVDNCSTNESVEKLNCYLNEGKKRFHHKYSFISSLSNKGYAAGNNIGIKAAIDAGAKYSLIINNDILFTSPDSVSKMYNYMEANNHIGALSPRIVSKDGSHDKPIYYKKPSFWDLSFGIKSYVKRIKDQNDELIYEVYAPRGSCMMLRNEDLKRIGLLDEGTFLYYEEPILAESLRKLNKTVVNFGRIHVIHNHAETIKSNISRKRNRAIVVESMDYYLKKYRKFNAFERMICRLVRKYAYLLSHK